MQNTKRWIPAPGIYETQKNNSIGGAKAKFYMAKAKNQTFFNDLIDASKKVPGVGKYDNSPKRKILGNYL